jgi:hypothetical protein
MTRYEKRDGIMTQLEACQFCQEFLPLVELVQLRKYKYTCKSCQNRLRTPHPKACTKITHRSSDGTIEQVNYSEAQAFIVRIYPGQATFGWITPGGSVEMEAL